MLGLKLRFVRFLRGTTDGLHQSDLLGATLCLEGLVMQARFPELGRCHEWISWFDSWLHGFNSRQLMKWL
jgi:hypothetical protein